MPTYDDGEDTIAEAIALASSSFVILPEGSVMVSGTDAGVNLMESCDAVLIRAVGSCGDDEEVW